MGCEAELSGEASDLATLVREYLAEMPQRIADLSDALQAKEWRHLQRLAHRVRGSAASYGFPEISEAASRLESLLVGERPEQEVAVATERLIACCEAAPLTQEMGERGTAS